MTHSGKIGVITGATSGIGAQAALSMAQSGFHLVLPVRNIDKGEAVKIAIKQVAREAQVDLMHCDLSSMESIREFSKKFNDKYHRLDVLINNAGVWESVRKTSADGIELTFAVNHLAPFLMTNLLIDKLKKSAPASIITVSSDAHKMGRMNFNDLEGKTNWSTLASYAQSKLANVLFTRKLAQNLEGSGVVANCLHPGFVATQLFERFPAFLVKALSLFMINPRKGAETIVYLATNPDIQNLNGQYFYKKKARKISVGAQNPDDAEKLWSISKVYAGI
ncbi:MAG TPA: SDR family oxidoreductase [Bacteroidales bacterium]|nr:SDR family oxidoreductase [Bacteroidales bacterium]